MEKALRVMQELAWTKAEELLAHEGEQYLRYVALRHKQGQPYMNREDWRWTGLMGVLEVLVLRNFQKEDGKNE